MGAALVGDYSAVLALLEKLRPRGTGRWTACCPAHDDVHPSLSVRVSAAGNLLLYCCRRPPCPLPEILRALSGRAGQLVHPYDLTPDGSFRGLRQTGAGKPRPRRRFMMQVLETYDYHQADGSLLYQVVRCATEKGPKDFRQRRPDGAGGWHWNLEGVNRVLYRLPQLLQARAAKPDRWIIVTEGEKDAKYAAHDGLVATTNPGGAGHFHLCDREPLRGANVAVVYDLDGIDAKRCTVAGFEHAMNVVNALYGVAAHVRLVRLPLPPGDGADYADWRCGPASGLSPGQARAALWGLVRQAPDWTPWGPILPAGRWLETSECVFN